jgi:hypothetical protein
MRTASKLSGVALATAAATLLLAGCGGKESTTTTKVEKEAAPAAAAKVAEIKCSGINSCKGTGACASSTHPGAGQNSCKGQGWVKASKADCDTKGGKVVAG